MSAPGMVQGPFAVLEAGEILPYDYRLYGERKAGSTDQGAVFVDKKSGIEFSAKYLVLSRLLRGFLGNFTPIFTQAEGYS
jgi:hypothetical protein